MKKDEKRLRDEISYWSRHQEIDKFNLTENLTVLFAVTAILLSLVQAVASIKKDDLYTLLLFLLSAIIISKVSWNVFWKNYDTANHFYVRNVMIEEMYAGMYGLKKGEFKKILEEKFLKEKEGLDKRLSKQKRICKIVATLVLLNIIGWIVFLLS